jgi:hypothetical protein
MKLDLPSRDVPLICNVQNSGLLGGTNFCKIYVMQETEPAFEMPCFSAIRMYLKLSSGPIVEYVASKGRKT